MARQGEWPDWCRPQRTNTTSTTVEIDFTMPLPPPRDAARVTIAVGERWLAALAALATTRAAWDETRSSAHDRGLEAAEFPGPVGRAEWGFWLAIVVLMDSLTDTQLTPAARWAVLLAELRAMIADARRYLAETERPN